MRPPATSPSLISLMRAPVARTRSISSSCRGRSRTTTVRSSTRSPLAAASASMLSSMLISSEHTPCPRSHGELLHVDDARRVVHRALLGQRHDRHGVRQALGQQRRAVDRVDGHVDRGSWPLPIRSPIYSIGASSFSPSPITTTPSIWMTLSRSRMALTAAWSRAFLLPRPIQRAAASAAASVTRHSSIAIFRSSPPPDVRLEPATSSVVNVMVCVFSSALKSVEKAVTPRCGTGPVARPLYAG